MPNQGKKKILLICSTGSFKNEFNYSATTSNEMLADISLNKRTFAL